MKEHVWVMSRGKRLSVMVHRPENRRADSPVVILCHGFTGDKVGASQIMLTLAKKLEQAGYCAVRFDFGGSGDSEGEFPVATTVSGWLADANSIVDWAFDQAEWREAPLVLLGHSLGGLVALCHEDPGRKLAGRVALAPVVYPVENFRDVIFGPALWEQALAGKTIANFYTKNFSLAPDFVQELVATDYDVLGSIARQTTPLLLIHGDADLAVPLSGSQELYRRRPGQIDFQVLAGKDHVFAGYHGEVGERIAAWLAGQQFRRQF